MPLGGAGASSFRGPLKHVHRSTTPFGTNPPGGPTTVGATMPYLTGCSLEDVDNLVTLPYGNIDDTPRQFGWSWAGCNYPGLYTAAGGSGGGLTTSSGGGTFADASLLGSGLTTTTASTAAAQISIQGAANMQAGLGKRMWFETRFRCGNIGAVAYLLGWVDTVLADITSAPTGNGIYFTKGYAATDLNFVVVNTGAATTITNVCAAAGLVAATVFAVNTDISLGILCDASMTAGGVFQKGAISCFVNGRFAGQVASTDPHVPVALMRYALISQGNSTAVATTYRQSLCQSEF